MNINELHPYEGNAKKHPKKQVDQIARSIKEFGFNQPIVVDKDNIIIVGHGRYYAAQQLGLQDVPVVKLETLTQDQVDAYRLADNKLNESEWDMGLVIEQLKYLDSQSFDITLTGFDSDLIIEPDAKDDEIPENAPTRAKMGDLWALGEHRVLCGDSTKLEDVERLMDGKKADMVFTDPPYGIAYDNEERWAGIEKQNNSTKRNKGKMILGDAEDFNPSFILSFFSYCKEIFIWGMQYYPEHLGRGGCIVWNRKVESQKNVPHADFELCWSKQERNKMAWITWGGFKSKEKGEERLHTTQKPIELAAWFFNNWGKELDLVIDLFLGSGSTLIAAQKTGRICYGMELDPKYVDVILKRWEDYTGETAILIT